MIRCIFPMYRRIWAFFFQFCLCNLEKSPEELQQDIGQLPSYARGRYQQDGGFDTIRDETIVCFHPIPQ